MSIPISSLIRNSMNVVLNRCRSRPLLAILHGQQRFHTMHRSLPLLLLMCMCGPVVHGQISKRFRHSVGAAAHIIPFGTGGASAGFGAYYEPQFNILNRYTDFSIAASMPLTLGAHIGNSYLPNTFFFGHVPVMMEANIGHFATRRFYNDIGMGAGAGYAMQITDKGVGGGPVFSVAARAWAAVTSITVRYIFHLNLQGSGYDTHGVALAINLGSFFKKLRADNALEKWQRPR